MKWTGGCLCGAIRYRASKAPQWAAHCHCGMCRKAHGSAFASYLAVRQDSLRIVEGDSLVTSYRSSQNVERKFCARCGSNLLFVPKGSEWMAVAMGILDDEPGATPTAHLHYDSRPKWADIPEDTKVFAGAAVTFT